MMFSRYFAVNVAGLALVAAAAAAQEGGIRVAVCNPARVFEQMDERKVIQDRLNNDREKLKVEAARRKLEIQEMIKDRDNLKPDSPQYQEKNEAIMRRTVEFEVWARLREQEMIRAEKEHIKALFDKIRAAAKEEAEARKIDLVLAERKPELGDMANLTPDQVRAALGQTDVLYSNERVDITSAVVLRLNKAYATGGEKK